MATVKRAEVVIDRGEGAFVWDESGRRLLDAPAGLWYCNVGHGRREIGAWRPSRTSTSSGLLTGVAVEDHATALRVSERCLGKGVLMRALPNAVLHVSPPFVVTEEDIHLLAEVLAEALDEEAAAPAAA